MMVYLVFRTLGTDTSYEVDLFEAAFLTEDGANEHIKNRLDLNPRLLFNIVVAKAV